MACGEIETAHPGYLGSQDTFYVGTFKGVGRICQQTFVDTYSKWAAAKVCTTKTPITGADLLNDRVLPFFEEHGMSVLRMLTDRGTEFCGKAEQHDYELFLAVNDIGHTKAKAQYPQTNGILASAFIKRCCTSSTRLPFGSRFTVCWKNCSRTWMRGSTTTTPSAHTKAKCVAAEGEKARSDWQINQIPPNRMTPEQRLREIASLLANGIARLRSACFESSKKEAAESEFELGFSGHQSVHTDPVNNTKSES